MKNKTITKIFGILAIIILTTSVVAGLALSSKTSHAEASDNQRAVQEIAMAYYRKGIDIQYEGTGRRDHWLSPEQITSQSANYFVCTGYTYAIYHEAFGMHLPQMTEQFNAYGLQFSENPQNNDYGVQYSGKQENPDIVFFEEFTKTDGKNALKDATTRTQFLNDIINRVQVGDIISYYNKNTNSGHAILIYDFNEGNTDASVLHASSSGSSTTEFSKVELRWRSELNSSTNVDEGTIRYDNPNIESRNGSTLSKILENSLTQSSDYFTILRPLAFNNGTYNAIYCDRASDFVIGEAESPCRFENVAYAANPSNEARLTYPGIDIEKTVDVFDNSTVGIGDTLTYQIAITNNSNGVYQNIEISDNISANVTLVEPGSATKIVDSIAAGDTYKYTYSVKVKDDTSLLGQDIVSTGSVVGIPSAVVTNHIGQNLTAEEKSQITSSYNSLKTQYSGAELIDAVYSDALEKDLEFSNFILGSAQKGNNTTGLQCNPYYDTEGVNSLIKTTYGGSAWNYINLNTENDFYKMLLGHYYSATSIRYNNSCVQQSNSYIISFSDYYANSQAESHQSDRRKRIYPETLQTGDILVYQDSGAKNSDGTISPDPITDEKGTYAFIWIEDSDGGGNFYGVNKLADNADLNMIEGVNEMDANNLWALYGKDYYAIFRPSLAFERPDDPDVPDDPDTPDGPDNPDGPDDPTDPDTPDEPSDPDIPDNPTNPDGPSSPDTPISPDASDNPSKNDINVPNTGSSASQSNEANNQGYLINIAIAASFALIIIYATCRIISRKYIAFHD